MAKAKEGRDTATHARQGTAGEQESSRESPQRMQRAGREGGRQGQQTGMSRRGQSPALMASPFSVMRLLNDELARLFRDIGSAGGALGSARPGETATWSPQVEVFERDGELVVRADLPGLTTDEAEVDITDDAIILRGERRQEHEEHRGGVSICELSHGSFYREIPLPEGVDTDRATATFRNGVLEIAMPIAQDQSRRRQLNITDAGTSAGAAASAGGREGRAGGEQSTAARG